MDSFRRLIEHLRWSDERILDALTRSTSAPRKALELYFHILGAEHVWLSRIHGRESRVAVWPDLDLATCRDLAEENARAFAEITNRIDEAELNREVHYRNSAGKEFGSTLQDILLHVAMHGQYHRGQVNLLLREAGGEPAPVDFIAFARGVAAATRGG
jgi:uncharacterized damage-inducible protein DinB